MGRKKVDVKISSLLHFCVTSRQRSLFFVLGKSAQSQIPVLYHLLRKARNENSAMPTVLWCFKREQGLSYLEKKSRFLQKKYAGGFAICEDDVFKTFLVSTDIQFCHYNDTPKILGQTFGMLILQDFEAVTPNIFARVVECIEGGGMIVFSLPEMQHLNELAPLKMDAHSRYCTYSHSKVHPRFNKRLVLSLMSCKNCLVLSDSLKIIISPLNFLSNYSFMLPTQVKSNLEDVVQNLSHLSDVSTKSLYNLCCTEDQVNALLKLNDALSNKKMKIVVSLTSARGRGKSATLGLAISLSLFLKISNVYITSPHIENIQTLFEFLIKGLKALSYVEGVHYSILYKEVENFKFISGIKITESRQKVSFFVPTNFSEANKADVVVIDEAAAIPLPLVKKWMCSDTVLMASTINGYEGTGRSLSLKLINQLRKQQCFETVDHHKASNTFELCEVTLNQAIRYDDEDCLETWLNDLFCLNVTNDYLSQYPDPKVCQLFYVNQDTLYSYHKVAEKFLQKLVALFVSSHYKNSPNDLFMMADAPAHHIFCLIPPYDKNSHDLPEILCAVQVCIEGNIPKEVIKTENSFRKRASGDLIPWIISQQFQDDGFAGYSSARIVRLATHPECNRMGYGRQTLQLLSMFYEGKFHPTSGETVPDITEEKELVPKWKNTLETLDKKILPPLLSSLNEVSLMKLHYIGVSYGLTEELFNFWKKCNFVPLYIRQTTSEITGEHSCIMIKILTDTASNRNHWLSKFYSDFIERFFILLTSSFRSLPASLALNILHYDHIFYKSDFTSLDWFLNPCSVRRLTAYCSHLVDYHLIMDLLPIICRFYFLHHFKEFFLTSIEEAVLLCIGLQHKSILEISMELSLETNKIMGMFMKSMKRVLHHITDSDFQLKNRQMNHQLATGYKKPQDSFKKHEQEYDDQIEVKIKHKRQKKQ